MTAFPKLIVVQLNEVNFDVVRRYARDHSLPGFQALFAGFDAMETFAEPNYEELEPWIQWVSAHTGKTYQEHRVFRLGDMAESELPQIFELIEAKGLKVGAVSPMNSRNRLRSPAYFVPDPWTLTDSDESGFSRRLTQMLRQTVNDNSQGRITMRSVLTLAEAIVRSFDPAGTLGLLRLIALAKGRPWIKALVLDQLIHLVHMKLMRQKRPDASFVFLNAGAHIQHHYFLNSRHSGVTAKNPAWYVDPQADPILDMLKVYDPMIQDYVRLQKMGSRLVVATGLTQVPYDRVKYYYRVKDHGRFLQHLGVRHASVMPRMTRDFEVAFDTAEDAQACKALLQGMRMQRDGQPLFNEIEDRGLRLFITLSYPHEILADDVAVGAAGLVVRDFGKMVSFVAIKNGMHSGKGFAFLSPGLARKVPAEPVHVASLFDLTLEAAS